MAFGTPRRCARDRDDRGRQRLSDHHKLLHFSTQEVPDFVIAIIGLAVGIAIGLFFTPDIPPQLAPYLPIAVIAALDAVLGGIRALIEAVFSDRVFVVSFLSNVVIAAGIVFVGDQLGVGQQLGTGVLVVLGIRIFTNASAIRRHLVSA